MGPAPHEQGSRLRRFVRGRRDDDAAAAEAPTRVEGARPADEAAAGGAAEPADAPTRVEGARPADEAATGGAAEPADAPTRVGHGEPLTRISARDPGGDRSAVIDAGATGDDDRIGQPGAPAGTAAPAAGERMPVPSLAPMAALAGWLAAWGLAALAAQCVAAAGVGLGQGFGLASAPGAADGTWSGVWLIGIQVVAWLLGGYVATRMARGHGARHAVLAWVLAMLATGADALTGVVRDGYTSVLAAIDIPSWIDTGLGEGPRTVAVYAAFAVAALVASLVGGAIGAGANALARRRVRA